LPEERWIHRTRVLWHHRELLAKVTGIALLTSLAIAFLIPKEYKSTASIMPPDQQSGAGAMMLAALSGRMGSMGALSSLASGLAGVHTSADLFIDLLRSGTVSSHLIDRFNLQHVYRKRYRVDAGKHLARLTKISENKKSGVITIEVEDTDRQRAQDLARGYLDELNKLVVETNTSAAHRERVFIEARLGAVKTDLEDAEQQLSRFASSNNAIDIKEQTRAMVDAGAHVQANLIVEQSGLQSLKQIYGDRNVRVREAEARIASLEAQLAKMTGSGAEPTTPAMQGSGDAPAPAAGEAELYPPLREMPRLAVPYTDLLRHVEVQEAVFQLLTQQYETARIEEAKDVPPVNVIDPPSYPEKKSFPPRLLLTLLLTVLAFASTCVLILQRHYWKAMSPADPRKMLAGEVLPVLRRRACSLNPSRRGAR